MRSTCSFSGATCAVAGLKQSGLAGTAVLPSPGITRVAPPCQPPPTCTAPQHPHSPRTLISCIPLDQGSGARGTWCLAEEGFDFLGGFFHACITQWGLRAVPGRPGFPTSPEHPWVSRWWECCRQSCLQAGHADPSIDTQSSSSSFFSSSFSFSFFSSSCSDQCVQEVGKAGD